MQGSWDSFLKSKKFFPKESGMREKFCPWNPESRMKTTLSLLLKYGTRNLEYHKRLEPEIQGPLTNTGIQDLESGIHGV